MQDILIDFISTSKDIASCYLKSAKILTKEAVVEKKNFY